MPRDGRLLLAFTASLVAAAIFPAVTAPAPSDLPAILISRQLLEQAHLHVGDTVTLARDANGSAAMRFRVAGVYEPTPDPMKFSVPRLEARLHLPDLTAIVGDPADPATTESASAVTVRVADPADISAFAADLVARTPGMFVQPTARSDDGSDPFVVLERFHLAIAIVTVIGSTAFLLALMVMKAEERRETVGILRLIGVSQRFILLEVLLEGLFIATAGAVFGIAVAAATQGLVNHFFQWRYDTTMIFVRVTPLIALRCVLFAVPLGVLAGLVASWTLLRRGVLGLIRR